MWSFHLHLVPGSQPWKQTLISKDLGENISQGDIRLLKPILKDGETIEAAGIKEGFAENSTFKRTTT
jgi:hypothetical protein